MSEVISDREVYRIERLDNGMVVVEAEADSAAWIKGHTRAEAVIGSDARIARRYCL